MSNRFVGWVKQKMILDGWISPEEHKKLLALIKDLEGKLYRLNGACNKWEANEEVLLTQLHQRDERIKELEGEVSSLEVQRKMANQVISDLQSQLHQGCVALVKCREALDLYESGTFDKGWAAMNAILQIDRALSQIQEVKS